jgi:hypothetical protein
MTDERLVFLAGLSLRNPYIAEYVAEIVRLRAEVMALESVARLTGEGLLITRDMALVKRQVEDRKAYRRRAEIAERALWIRCRGFPGSIFSLKGELSYECCGDHCGTLSCTECQDNLAYAIAEAEWEEANR